MPQIPIAAVFSFLKDTRGVVDWTVQDLAKTLKISLGEARRIVELMQVQGYIKPAGNDTWLTSLAGENVSGSVTPRFARESVEHALASLKERIRELNRDSQGEFSVGEAVAFGDYLSHRPRVQAAEVGIDLTRKGGRKSSASVTPEQAAEVLKKLKNKSSMLHMRHYEDWMSARTHRKLL
jgi:hypothetical protein